MEHRIGDQVIPINVHFTLASGAQRYTHAYVVCLDPFQLISEEGDMLWRTDVNPEGYKRSRTSTGVLPRPVINRMVEEGLMSAQQGREARSLANGLVEYEEDQPEVMLEVTPQQFKSYQEQIATYGMTNITFKQYTFDQVKVETQLAILIRKGEDVAWVPKSCLYRLEQHYDGWTVYIRKDFPVVWNKDR